MDNKRVLNHLILPLSIMALIFVLNMYPNKMVIIILSLFMIPSILFNIVFILSPLYGKVYIVQKVNFFVYKIVMFTISLLYVLNMVLVFGNLTLVDFSNDGRNYIASGSMFICHFCLQMSWMWLHFQQMLTLYYWIQYMRNYNYYLLEATFIQSNF